MRLRRLKMTLIITGTELRHHPMIFHFVGAHWEVAAEFDHATRLRCLMIQHTAQSAAVRQISVGRRRPLFIIAIIQFILCRFRRVLTDIIFSKIDLSAHISHNVGSSSPSFCGGRVPGLTGIQFLLIGRLYRVLPEVLALHWRLYFSIWVRLRLVILLLLHVPRYR